MKEKVAIISILANIFLAGSKILVGTISGSASVLADGIHSLTDIFSSVVGYFGIKISQKPVDQKHPYGHYKSEVLSGVVITLLLLAAGAEIIHRAYSNLFNPEKILIDSLTLSVMFLSVLINFATSKLKIHYGKKENSLTLLSDGTHDKADVLASMAVLVGLFFSRYWVYADSVLAFLIGLYIIKESFSLGKEAVDSLLDVSAGQDLEEKMKKIAEEQKIEIASLKTQKKGSAITANLEIILPSQLSVDEATKIADKLREKFTLAIENLIYVAIQIKSHEASTGFYKPFLGKDFGWQRRGKFKGEIEQASGKGPKGNCVCPKCKYKMAHQVGVPCSTLRCPNCGINLERQ